jgi:hypothetical protein
VTLIVETGAGASAAESYASVADADQYHSDRGNAAWDALDTGDKERALRRSTDFMTQTFRGRWKGYRSNIAQALDWPRKSVILTDMAINYMVPFASIPREVKVACMELALRSLAGDLAGDLTQNIINESGAGFATTYDRYTPQYTRYRAVEMLLSPYLAQSGASMSLTR